MKRFIFSYSTEQLIPYIDWSYFFHAWGIKNKNTSGADDVKRDAEQLLAKLRGKHAATAIFALCDAKSDGDDIIMGKDIVFPLLRQQHARADEPDLCLSDFISPHGDKIGLFATAVSDFFTKKDESDTYTRLLTQTVACRLAEAAASLLHTDVRRKKELWGYVPDERLTIQEINMERFQGIRPAVGYPSLPDQSVIFIIDNILNLKEAGITLTANGAMLPHAAVCGLMFAHPASRYFGVGNISDEQLHDYALRRGLLPEELSKFLYKNIVK